MDSTGTPPTTPRDPQDHDAAGGTWLEYFADPFEPFFDAVEDLQEEELPGEDDDWEALDFHDLAPEAPDITELVKERIRKAITPKRILLRDKVAYVLGSVDLLVSAFWLGASPTTFHKLYTAKSLVLFTTRWIIYRTKRQHYYLLDFCYLVQGLLLLQVWCFPTNISFIKMVFAFAHGPLLWSILAFRNSLVYHSLDKLTSLFTHWTPAALCWGQRWFPPPELVASFETSPARQAQWESVSFRDLCLLPMIPYIAWAVAYYLKVFVISSARIQARNYETLFVFVTRSRKGLFAAVVLRFPRQLQPVVYMALHLLMTFSALAVSMVFWKDRVLGMGFILLAFAWSAWNGATYYFDHFAYKYVAGLGLKRTGDGATPPKQQDKTE